MSDLDPSGVQVQPDLQRADVSAGPSNGFLQLASAVGQAEPEFHDAVGAFLQQEQAKQSAKANADALAQSGTALADAVREGKIEPTQNPYYIQAYNRDSAMIRSRAQVSALVDQSQTWAERNDPAAYQQKFSQALGEIAQDYTHVDAQKGFEAGAQPLYEQAVNQNVEYNVQRIQQENEANNTTLMTTGLQDAIKANGGVLTPEAASKVLTPLMQRWVSLGGTPQTARMLALRSVIGAAANTGDTDVMNVLQHDLDGKGPLSAMVDPKSGQPVGLEVDMARYRIDGAVRAENNAAANALNAQRMKIGNDAVNQILSDPTTGNALVDGKMSIRDVEQAWKAKGLDPQAILFGAGILEQRLAPLAHLGDTLTSVQQTAGGGGPAWNELTKEAIANGYSNGFANRVNMAEAQGQITAKEADQLYQQAATRMNAKENLAAAQEERNQRLADRKKLQAVAAYPDTAVAIASQALEHPPLGPNGKPLQADYSITRDPQLRRQLRQDLIDANRNALAPYAADPVAGAEVARAAVNAKLAEFLKQRTQRLLRAQQQPVGLKP